VAARRRPYVYISYRRAVLVASAPAAVSATGTSAPLAGQVRLYLAGIAAGAVPASDPAVWSALAPRGALGGTPERPELTEVGRQVLHALDLCAYRADTRPLNDVAAEIERGVANLATMADTAQYFLSELGPVPPVEVVPLLRIVAAHLSVRHESPEDLVEEFKNGWGEAEVLGGTPADRLLAAELMTGSGVPQDEFYSAMVTTVDRLRDARCASPVATAAILHLFPVATNTAPIDRWTSARQRVANDEGAALLAGFPDLAATLGRWEQTVGSLGGDGVVDAELAAIYLTSTRRTVPLGLSERVREAASLFEGSFARPLLAGAVAVAHLGLSSAESADWLEKAVAQASARRLAPDAPQLSVLGLALLEGLDPAGFAKSESVPAASGAPTPSAGLAARTALHAWMYRDLVTTTRSPR
jgi:hypothetical protein